MRASWEWLAQTVECPPDKSHEFTVTATAMGLSLNPSLVPRALIRGVPVRPGRSTIPRWGVSSRPAWSGSWGGRPTTARERPGRRRGTTARRCRTSWRLRQRACQRGAPPCHGSGRRTSSPRWRVAWRCATRPRRPAGSCVGAGTVRTASGSRPKRPAAGSRRRRGRAEMPGAWRSAARAAWTKAQAAFQQDERSEAGGTIAHAALQVFHADGQWNDRSWPRQQRMGAASVVRTCLDQGAWLSPGGSDVDVPGPAAPPVAGGRTRGPVAWGIGAVMVAASAAVARDHCGGDCRRGPCGASGAAGRLPEAGRVRAGIGSRGGAGVASEGTGPQCGGVHEQRAAEAPVATPDVDAGAAGPEASVRKLSCVSCGETTRALSVMRTWA